MSTRMIKPALCDEPHCLRRALYELLDEGAVIGNYCQVHAIYQEERLHAHKIGRAWHACALCGNVATYLCEGPNGSWWEVCREDVDNVMSDREAKEQQPS